MDYYRWGAEYLEEAAKIKSRIETLRESLDDLDTQNERNLIYRINMLYAMYLDCRKIGLLLQSYDAKEEDAKCG